MSEKKESGKVYACKLCKKTFKQKCDYDKHTNKKTPCISLAACEALIVKKDEGGDSKKDLTTFFKNCLDILRDNEGLTGEKALRNLSYLLILKLLEPHFGGIIDIDNYEYDFSCFEEEDIEHNRVRLLSCVRFSNLSKENEDNIPNMMKYLWDIILSVHPSTKNIFLPDKKFDIQRQSTYKKIIDKLNRIDLSSIENDILGDSYEEVIQYIMTGKVLGQFFTPHLIKKFMVALIDPQIFPNGRIESCCDPTMGTGGFLIEYIRVIQEKAKLNDISLDWQFIKNGGLYGKELEPDTYQLAVSNMLISTGYMFEQLERGDSIREPIEQKFDNLLVNPPFGIKGLKYDDFNYALKEQYLPIKTDNAVSLFIQAIIFMLKIGGKCAIVLPDGQDLFSKTNTTLVAIREYLMKTCDLKEIYYLPSGIFEHTTIKTCIFYFVKKREGNDVLRVKAQKKSNWEYEFSKTLMTKNVQFYDYNPYENVKNLLVEVPIEKIASNSYSLNYSDYLRDDVEEEQYEDGIVLKNLGEICDFQNGRGIKKDTLIDGEYPVIGGGQKPLGFHNQYNTSENTILCSSSGAYAGFISKYDKKVWASDCFKIIPMNGEIDNNYLYYLLKTFQKKIYKLQTGTAQPHIYSKDLVNLKIPIPPLEYQQEIVKYLDFIYEKSIKTSIEKIGELKQLNDFCLTNQIKYGDNPMKNLGEICDFQNGRGIKKDTLIDGEYPVIGGGQKPLGFHNQYNTSENTILCSSSGAYAGFISKYDKKVWASDCFKIIPMNGEIDNNYLYYLLKTFQDKIYKLQTGTAQPHIYSKDLVNLKIPIPSLERQKEIVTYCEFNDELIIKLEMEIEKNKKEAKQFLKNAVKSKVQED